jgi:Flp pilus assembly protein CpaB
MAASTAPSATPTMSSWDKVPTLKPSRKKSNPLFVIALVAVVVLGASGFWRATHTAPAMPMVKVVSAIKDIPAGTRLGFLAVRYLDVPKKFATTDMITSLNDINGHVTRTFLQGGEPIQAFMLFPGHDGLSMNLDTHERAITLQLNDDTTVDHSIQPDDVVDILAVSNKDGKKYTKTICQAARVVMAAPKEQLLSRTSGTVNNMVTLAVAPEMAETITEAMETGKIRLLLRNRLSRVQHHLAGVKPEDLLPTSAQRDDKLIAAPLAMAVPPPPVKADFQAPTFVEPPDTAYRNAEPLGWIVEMFKGGHKESLSVPEH